jgi:FxsC-like protein
MVNWFFLSHARFDRVNDPQNCISRFYADLIKRIRTRRGADAEAFIDETSLQLGDKWPDALEEALNTCRALVCIFSRAYFNSDYCGKEFRIFLDRMEGQPEPPPLILPVMLSPPEDVRTLERIRHVVADIHDVDGGFPKDYVENGLEYMMVRTSQQENYRNFVDRFGDRLIALAEQHQLPPLPEVPDIKNVTSAWARPAADADAPADSAGSAPEDETVEFADFIYVAATRQQIERLQDPKPDPGRYGPRGGLDWKPYLPKPEEPMWNIAQAVATKEKFHYLPVQTRVNDLSLFIREARRKNRIVVILVDSWALYLDVYHNVLSPYDDLDPLNSVMLVVWNFKDDATVSSREAIRGQIELVFPVKAGRQDLAAYLFDIGTPEDLQKFLAIALQEARSKIIRVNQRFRTAGESRPLRRLGEK